MTCFIEKTALNLVISIIIIIVLIALKQMKFVADDVARHQQMFSYLWLIERPILICT